MAETVRKATYMGINPFEITGNWDKGYVLDRHVLVMTKTMGES